MNCLHRFHCLHCLYIASTAHTAYAVSKTLEQKGYVTCVYIYIIYIVLAAPEQKPGWLVYQVTGLYTPSTITTTREIVVLIKDHQRWSSTTL